MIIKKIILGPRVDISGLKVSATQYDEILRSAFFSSMKQDVYFISPLVYFSGSEFVVFPCFHFFYFIYVEESF